jgi:hypothetical protein
VSKGIRFSSVGTSVVDQSDQVPPERVQGRVDGCAPQASGFAAVELEIDRGTGRFGGHRGLLKGLKRYQAVSLD